MKILIAEDDEETATYVGRLLEEAGHEISRVETGDDAVAALNARSFDVALLDRLLPGRDGIGALRACRDAGVTTPILMLTALGGIADRVDGLEAGADDYLVKPFAASELLARVNALGRRGAAERAATTLIAGRVRVDMLRREAWVGERLVPLQPRELRLLEELMRGAGTIVTRAMLLERVWRFHFEPQTNLVESHLSRLRAKLGLAGARDVIETVRGSGYRFGSGR